MPAPKDDSPYSKFFWVVVSTAALGMVGTAGAFMNLNSNVNVMSNRIGTLENRLVKVEDKLDAASSQRYTSTDASADRAAVITQIQSSVDWNRRQDDAINELRLKLAAMETVPSGKR